MEIKVSGTNTHTIIPHLTSLYPTYSLEELDIDSFFLCMDKHPNDTAFVWVFQSPFITALEASIDQIDSLIIEWKNVNLAILKAKTDLELNLTLYATDKIGDYSRTNIPNCNACPASSFLCDHLDAFERLFYQSEPQASLILKRLMEVTAVSTTSLRPESFIPPSAAEIISVALAISARSNLPSGFCSVDTVSSDGSACTLEQLAISSPEPSSFSAASDSELVLRHLFQAQEFIAGILSNTSERDTSERSHTLVSDSLNADGTISGENMILTKLLFQAQEKLELYQAQYLSLQATLDRTEAVLGRAQRLLINMYTSESDAAR